MAHREDFSYYKARQLTYKPKHFNKFKALAQITIIFIAVLMVMAVGCCFGVV